MIISASRRTDIPAYYSDWFFERLKAGYVCVRNPMNPHMVSRVSLNPEVVDGIVFWTKNPTPMLRRLGELDRYPYYFQFTLTPYGTDVEKNVPSKRDCVIPAFQKLSSQIGKERLVWRYDPILLTERYTIPYHTRYFRLLCDRLANCTEKCTISFVDLYDKIQNRIAPLGIRALSTVEMEEVAGRFTEIAREHEIYIDTCSEAIDLSRYGVRKASCIDKERLERIGGYVLNAQKDKSLRDACGCVSSIDIGAYDTCPNGCIYCYANRSMEEAVNRCKLHDPHSPFLHGNMHTSDIVKDRKMYSLRETQIKWF